MVAADFRSFIDAQKKVSEAYLDRESWTRMSIINSAKSGKFSTDRTITEYSDDIWHLSPVAVKPNGIGA